MITKKLFDKKPKCIKSWFALNVDYKNNNLIPLPLGIANDYSFKKNIVSKDLFLDKKEKNFHEKKVLVYVNFNENTNKKERSWIKPYFNKIDWAEVEKDNLSVKQYIDKIKNASFVICPWGNGVDSHRVWETLFLGSIPIIKKHTTFNNLNGLPIYFVDDFKELTEEKLKEFLVSLRSSESLNTEKLNVGYWENIVNEQKNLKDIGNSFIIHHHLGLGDSIICNGLVNYLSKKNNKVYLPVKSNLLEHINYLYSDNNDVEIFEINNESREQDILHFAEKNSLKILRIGFDNIGATAFNLAFYKQLGFPYRYSYKYFNLPEAIDKEVELQNHLIDYYNVDPKNYSIVHNEYQWPGGTFDLKNIDKKNTIFVTRESDIFNNIFYYKKLIQDANTIHCINGSFLHLVERVKNSAKLYYHHLRKNKLHLSNKWTYVDYES